jgi:hypothetical protein
MSARKMISVRKKVPGTAAAAVLVVAYAVIPRRADLRAFDPAGSRLGEAYRPLIASVSR